MKRNTKIILSVIAASSIATGTFAFAGGGHGQMGERMVNRLSDRLELSEQQSNALSALQVELSETRELMRGDLNSDSQSLKELISAESFDQGAALEMITARTTAMQAQGPELVAATAVFLDGLNAEQKQELSELMDRFSDRRGGEHKRKR